ncbi:MAG TPA: hypothetical protein VGK56_04100, partial [Anaerolineales bacterium]
MSLRVRLLVFALILSGCDISVTSFPTSPPTSPVTPTVEDTELPPTPYPDTPAPPAIAGAPIETPALIEIQFFNDLDGWALTETFLVRTNDGGITWYDVTPPDLEEAGATVETFFLDKDHAWVQKPDFNNFPDNGL